jgi:hypothetical protein
MVLPLLRTLSFYLQFTKRYFSSFIFHFISASNHPQVTLDYRLYREKQLHINKLFLNHTTSFFYSSSFYLRLFFIFGIELLFFWNLVWLSLPLKKCFVEVLVRSEPLISSEGEDAADVGA